MGYTYGAPEARFERLGPLDGNPRVQLARDRGSGARVVLKGPPRDADDAARLAAEARLHQRLAHPSLSRLVEVLWSPAGPCLVLAYAEGPDLVSWARAATSSAIVARSCRAVGRLLEPLAYLHRRAVVHCDLKPEHVRVTAAAGTPLRVTLLDLGLARRDPPTETVGTRGYIAPEVAAGGAASFASDLYGVGALLHHALLGIAPELGPRHAREGIAPRALHELVFDLLAPSPARRPSLARVAEVLSLVLAEHDTGGAHADDDVELWDIDARVPQLLCDRHQLLLGGAAERIVDGSARLVRLSGAATPKSLSALCDLVALADIPVVRVDRLGELEDALGLSAPAPDDGSQRVARVVEALRERERAGPLLLALQRMDDELARLLARLGEIGVDGPADPETAAVWLDVAANARDAAHEMHSVQVVLPTLAHDEIRSLVRAALADRPSTPATSTPTPTTTTAASAVEPPWLDALASASGGEPTRLLAGLRAQLAVDQPGEHLAHEAVEALGVSSAVAALDGRQRRLLAILTMAPRPVPLAVLEAVTGESISALGDLGARELVLLDHRGISAAAALTAKAARPRALRLDHRQRRRVHARYASAWRAVAGSPALIGHHLLAAGDVDAAVLQLAAADDAEPADLRRALEASGEIEAGGALEGGGNIEAGADMEARDIEAARAQILVRVARMQRAAGDIDGALAVAASAPAPLGARLSAELLLDAGDPQRALELLAELDVARDAEAALVSSRAKILRGDFDGAAADARRGLASSAAEGLRLRLHNALGLAQLYSGQVDEAHATLQDARLRAVEASARTPSTRATEIEARLCNSLGIVYQRLEQLDKAHAAYSACLTHFRRLGDLRLAATCALNLGTVAHQRGRYADALSAYRDARRLSAGATLGSTAAWAAANEGNLLADLGAFDAAAARLDQARALAGGVDTLLGHVLLFEGDLARQRGDAALAAQLLARARDRFAADDAAGRREIGLLAGELALQAGDDAAARAALAELDALQHSAGHADAKPLLLAARYHARSAPRRALELVEQAIALAPAPLLRFSLFALAAELSASLGDSARAAELAGRATGELAERRAAVPPQHRHSFDQHPDVVAARARVASAGGADALGGSPSPAGIARVLEINRELNQRVPTDVLLERILDGAIELSGAERGFILLLGGRERRGNKLRLVAARTAEGERVRRGLSKLSHSIAEQVLAERRSLVVADAGADVRFRQRLSVSGLKLRAVLCVPLVASGQLRGALYLDNRYGVDVFSQSKVGLAEAFAEQAGIALENARLLEQATRHGDELAAAKAELEQLNRRLEAELAQQSAALSEIRVRLDHQEEELVRRYNAAKIVGRSKPLRQLFAQLDRVARADLPVVIHGESGTGKELVARALHRQSSRASAPFVAINCGAIPANLLESELFGSTRGAFTGAVRDRPGMFEVAADGTLFLDEVGDMDAEMQVKLLRILQEGTFRRLGDDRERESRCRVLSASHKRLHDLVAAGQFREDLYYRLHVLSLDVPPLRERRDDVPLLIEHVLGREAARRGGEPVQVSRTALRALVDYDWPGNVRELENELSRAALLCEGRIELADLSAAIAGDLRAAPAAASAPTSDLRTALAAHERVLVAAALERADGSVTEAAKALGLHRVALHRKMRVLGIERPRPRRAREVRS